MGRRRGTKQSDQRSDMRGSGFVGLPKVVYESAAWRAASPTARLLLLELLARFNGYNNGDINLDVRSAADALGRRNQAGVSSAFGELMTLGFLDLAAEAVWQQRRARRWRLTFISTGTPPAIRPASNEYLRWSPGDSSPARSVKRPAPRKYCATRGVAETPPTATRCVAEPTPGCDAVCSKDDGNVPFFHSGSATRGVAVIGKPYEGLAIEHSEPMETSAAVSADSIGDQLLEQLRERALLAIGAAGVGAQTRLADAARIPGGTLSKFLAGKGLARSHFITLQMELGKLERRAA